MFTRLQSVVSLAAVLAAMLSGCGGGGGDTQATRPSPLQLPQPYVTSAVPSDGSSTFTIGISTWSGPSTAIGDTKIGCTDGTTSITSQASGNSVIVSNLTNGTLYTCSATLLTKSIDFTDSVASTEMTVTPYAALTIKQGQFVDSQVSGLNYTAGPLSGVTDSAGHFNYTADGETVQFFAGKIPVGSAPASTAIHVFDLSSTLAEMAAGKNIRVAQLLQSLDLNAGKTNTIQLPANLASKLITPTLVDFSASQTSFDSALSNVLSLAGSAGTVVSNASAKTFADIYAIELAKGCPLPLPISPDDSIKTGNLSCLDRAKVNYYISQINPLINYQIDMAGSLQVIAETSYNSAAAAKAIDGSPVLAQLNAFGAAIDFIKVDPGKTIRSTVTNLAFKASNTVAAQSQVILKAAVQISPGSSLSEKSENTDRYIAVGTNIIKALSESKGCADFLTAQKKTKTSIDSAKCIDAIKIYIEATKDQNGNTVLKLSPTIDTKTINASLKLIADGFGAVSNAIVFSNAADEDGVNRAAFGLAESASKVVRDSLILRYENTGPGGTGLPDDIQFVANTIDNVFVPVLQVAGACYGDLAPLDVFQCGLTATTVILKSSTDAVFSALNAQQTFQASSTLNEAIATREVLQEILWTGEGNMSTSLYKKYDKYNLHDLIASIALTKVGLVAVDGYLDPMGWFYTLLSYVSGNFATFDYKNVEAGVRRHLDIINRNVTPNYITPSISLALSSVDSAGTFSVGVTVDPTLTKYVPARLSCVTSGGTIQGGSPWGSPVSGTIPTVVSFSTSFSSGGNYPVQCSLFTASGVFIGGVVSVANVSVNAPPTASFTVLPTTVATGQSVTFNPAASTDPNGSITSFAWNFGDGQTTSTSTNSSVNHSYATAGTYTVSLTTTDNQAAQTSTTQQITVSAQPGKYVLNDTGVSQMQCYTPYNAGYFPLASCSDPSVVSLNSMQDGAVGLDLTDGNPADGALGFSFTKLDAFGNSLPADAPSWVCVKDNRTGLVWELKTGDGTIRDASKRFTVDTASGYASALSAAKLCGFSDWRIPKATELSGLYNFGLTGLDPTYFPFPSPWALALASDPYLYGANSVWGINGTIGSVGGISSSRDFSLIGVRGGFSYLPSSDNTRYSPSADGSEVTDTVTGLIWRRCPEGAIWDGSTCGGQVHNFYSHDAALTYSASQTGWRLPNIKELESIVDRTQISPAQNTYAFPVTTGSIGSYWSSTPVAPTPGWAWICDYGGGGTGNLPIIEYAALVRLVRDK